MPVVISQALVLSYPVDGGPDAPLIGWHNLVTVAGVEADEQDPDFPASNMANPSTASRWQALTTDEQFIVVTLSGVDQVDYVGVARHNWGSGQTTASVEIPDTDNPGDWIEVAGEMIPAGDQPIVFHFDEVQPAQIRIRLQPGAVVPRAAVLYVGKLLRLQRGIQPGSVPLTWGASDDVVDAQSEAGDYLGAIVMRQSLETTVSVQWMEYDWWRANMRGFVAHARQRKPFFFAWLPESYPDEVGYAWVTSDIRPETQNLGDDRIAVHFNLDMKAVAT